LWDENGAVAESRRVTLANRITLVRLILIPVFNVLVVVYKGDEPWIRYAALSVFLVASVSDALDGFVARAYNQKTRLGAVLDPLADKLLLNLAFVFLAVNENFAEPVPQWVPVLILSRDVIIVMGSYLINEFYGPLRVRPRISGKATTALQMASIVAVLLEVNFAYELVLLMVAVSVFSFFDYIYVGVRRIGNEDRV
jgi:CDP-diacylglycerol--glycerol-3-phosphate 3-phosphatidyltransferase